jgi:hypothetical protein
MSEADDHLLIHPVIITTRSIGELYVAGPRDVTINPLLGDGAENVAGPAPSDTGLVSGPGNQGTANIAHMGGQAGTGAAQISIPRMMKRGAGGGSGTPSPAPAPRVSEALFAPVEAEPLPLDDLIDAATLDALTAPDAEPEAEDTDP